MGFALGGSFVWSLQSPTSPYDITYKEPAEHKPKTEPNEVTPTKEVEERLATYTLWLAIFTAVLAGSTIGLWIVTYLGSRKQSRDMQASIAAAEKSAKAANRTAQALIDAERPWVGLVTITNVAVGKSVIYADVITQNTGRTPARNLRTKIVGDIQPKGVLPPIPDTGSEPARALIPDILDYYRPFEEGRGFISQDTYNAIVAGDQVIWIVGRMDYVDGAGAHCWTSIRAFWKSDGRFHPHLEDNEAT